MNVLKHTEELKKFYHECSDIHNLISTFNSYYSCFFIYLSIFPCINPYSWGCFFFFHFKLNCRQHPILPKTLLHDYRVMNQSSVSVYICLFGDKIYLEFNTQSEVYHFTYLTIASAHMHAQSLKGVWFFEIPWTVACQALLSMKFSRQEYRTGLPCRPLGDFPEPGTELESLLSPALEGGFFANCDIWEAPLHTPT